MPGQAQAECPARARFCRWGRKPSDRGSCRSGELDALAAARDNGRRPPIEDQCDDNALGKQFRAVAAGRVGDLATKDLVPLIHDERLLVVKEIVKESTLAGTKESTQDKLADPSTMDAVRRVWCLFRTNLLMCVAANPHRELLQVTPLQLEELYRFVDGPLLSGRSPQPGPHVMLAAERAMWRHLGVAVHKRQHLATAIDEIKTNSLFWTHWVYARWEPPPVAPLQQARQQPWYQHWPEGKGKYKPPSGAPGKGKGHGGPYAPTGKGGSKQGQSGRAWVEPAEVDQKYSSGEFAAWVSGKYSCAEYQKFQCRPGKGKSCGGSHACPKVLQSGQPCASPHHRGMHCTMH